MRCPKCGTKMKPRAKVSKCLLEVEKRQGEKHSPIIYECPNCFRLQRF